jgi:hypothetical protein
MTMDGGGMMCQDFLAQSGQQSSEERRAHNLLNTETERNDGWMEKRREIHRQTPEGKTQTQTQTRWNRLAKQV